MFNHDFVMNYWKFGFDNVMSALLHAAASQEVSTVLRAYSRDVVIVKRSKTSIVK